MSTEASLQPFAVRRPSPALARVRAYVSLTKPRIIELLLITTVPTMFVASQHLPSVGLVLLVLAGGSLAAGGANVMNMIYDRDIDAVMERTKNRPLVTGAVSVPAAITFAVALEASAFILLACTVNLLSAVLALSATAFYVLIYTMWLKRNSSQNIVIGGAAGAVPVLVGWSSVTGHLGLAPLVLFAIIFLWTPPHFWALALKYRNDYERARVPMLPAVLDEDAVVSRIIIYTALLWACSLAIAPVAHLGATFFAISFVLGGAFFVRSLQLRKDNSARRAMRLFGFSITYLTVLFVSMGVVAAVLHP